MDTVPDAPATNAKACCGCGNKSSPTGGTEAATDPVCGMKVDPATPKHHADHQGATYHVCSAGCRTKFVANPEGYTAPKAVPAAKPGEIYTCPMHPQLRQRGQGSCPICGMALEPLVATADATTNREPADMSRRFWIGLIDRSAARKPFFSEEKKQKTFIPGYARCGNANL